LLRSEEAEDVMAEAWAAVRTPEDLGRILGACSRGSRSNAGGTRRGTRRESSVYQRNRKRQTRTIHGAPVSDVAPSRSAPASGADRVNARAPLDVWLYGTRVATITDHGREIQLRRSQDAYKRWGQGGRVVSHLLPIDRPSEQPHHLRVRAFLAGWLPEGNIRERYAHAAGVTSDDIFGMIRAYGKETAGALIFVEEGAPEPDRIGTRELVNDAQIGAMLAEAAGVGPAFAASDGHRLQSTSLAGIQPKIVLSRTSDGWARCLDGYPSTYIAKLAHPPESYAKDVEGYRKLNSKK